METDIWNDYRSKNKINTENNGSSIDKINDCTTKSNLRLIRNTFIP